MEKGESRGEPPPLVLFSRLFQKSLAPVGAVPSPSAGGPRKTERPGTAARQKALTVKPAPCPLRDVGER